MIIESNVVEYQLSDSKITEDRDSKEMTSLDMIVLDLTRLLQQPGLESTKAFETASKFVEKLKRIQRTSMGVPNKSSIVSNNQTEAMVQDSIGKLQESKKPGPPAITTTANIDGMRTFDGQYRENWKVGNWVELNHRYMTWLPGTVTRASFNDQGDIYDVKLRNGDVVLNVITDKLRSWRVPVWLVIALCAVGGFVAFFAFVWAVPYIFPSPSRFTPLSAAPLPTASVPNCALPVQEGLAHKTRW